MIRNYFLCRIIQLYNYCFYMEAYLQVTSQHVKSTSYSFQFPVVLGWSPGSWPPLPPCSGLALSSAWSCRPLFHAWLSSSALLKWSLSSDRACWPLLLQATLYSLYCVCGLLTWSLEQARTAALMLPRSAPTLRKDLWVNPQCPALCLPHQICFLS